MIQFSPIKPKFSQFLVIPAQSIFGTTPSSIRCECAVRTKQAPRQQEEISESPKDRTPEGSYHGRHTKDKGNIAIKTGRTPLGVFVQA